MYATQKAMVQAAAGIAALMPAKPAKTLLGNREQQLVYSVFEAAAKAAYRRAAQECFNAAYSAAGGGVDFEATHEFIKGDWMSLQDLIAMCEPGFGWGGPVVTCGDDDNLASPVVTP